MFSVLVDRADPPYAVVYHDGGGGARPVIITVDEADRLVIDLVTWRSARSLAHAVDRGSFGDASVATPSGAHVLVCSHADDTDR